MPTHSGADMGARPRKQSQIGYVDETWLSLDPERAALLGDAIGLVLLVVLETLAPAERLAFVLHDVFAIPFDEIAAIIGRTPDATRQLASRARRRGGPCRPSRDGGRERCRHRQGQRRAPRAP